MDWCLDPNVLVDVRTVTGPGGQGKTRFALQLAQALLEVANVRQPEWVITGFLRPDPAPPGSVRDLMPLADSAFPALIVIDYADTRLEQITRLLPTLWEVDSSSPARVLFLARTSGDWWTRLTRTYPRLSFSSIYDLPTLDDAVEARQRAYDDAATRFAIRLAEMDSTHDWQAALELSPTPEDLNDDRYGSPLMLQVSALISLIRTTTENKQENTIADNANRQCLPKPSCCTTNKNIGKNQQDNKASIFTLRL